MVSQFNLDVAENMAKASTIGERRMYGYWRKYAPSFAVNMGDSVAELIANQRGLELETLKASFPNVFVETYPTPVTEPEPEPISLPSIYGGQYVPGVEPEPVPEPEPEPVSLPNVFVETYPTPITEPEPELTAQ